jgi:membrane-bound lytic murein transglycosylase D
LREGKPTDFWNVKLPRETRNYVPQLLALASIVSDPDKYNVTLPEIPFEPYFTAVQVNHQIALSTIVDITGVAPPLFTQLNAAYRRSITPPEGSYQILLPRANAKDFRSFIDTTNPRTWIPHKEYIIASGDTLSHIALRFNVPVSSIKKRNGLLGDRLTIGNTLYIPEGDGKAMVVPKIMRYKTISHIVTSGDTLSSLAIKYGTSVRDLRAQNGLNSELIRIGQALDILVPSASTKSTKLRRLFYTVKSGDSLYLIAKKFSLLISDITRWNKISREEYLQPGQKLTLFINPRII